MDYIIKPFIGVDDIQFGMDRNQINDFYLKDIPFSSAENTNVVTGQKSINDYFDNGIVMGYLDDFKLKYIVLMDGVNAIFNDVNLFDLNYSECRDYLAQFDPEIEDEEYVGFTSYKLGIAIYCPNATDEPDSYIESITIAERGYF